MVDREDFDALHPIPEVCLDRDRRGRGYALYHRHAQLSPFVAHEKVARSDFARVEHDPRIVEEPEVIYFDRRRAVVALRPSNWC